ncbi:MAG TPA: LysE family translocator [Candidatus Dormibacteraeota bacterium]|nr:LysE family translocator [Candidatus Dormibacteraeota bacterium]
MIDARFGAYLAVATLLIITPGPDTALTIRNALRFGRRAASMSTFGIALGSLAWGIAAVLGIAVLLERSVVAFTIFKIAGAGYLVFLGLRSIVGSMRSSKTPSPVLPTRGREVEGSRNAPAFVLQGLLNNLLNPKAGAIFATVFPQFISPTDSPVRLIWMMAAYEVMLVVWLNLYGFVISRAGQARMTARFRRAIERVTGAILVGLGVRLAFESR